MLILWHPRFRKLFVQRTFIAQSCSVSELLDPEEIESSHKINSLLHYAIQYTRSRFCMRIKLQTENHTITSKQ